MRSTSVKREVALANSKFIDATRENAEHLGEVVSYCSVCGEAKFKFEQVDTDLLGPIVLPCQQECACDRAKPTAESLAFRKRLKDVYALSEMPPDTDDVSFSSWDARGSGPLKVVGTSYCINFEEYRRNGTGFVLQGAPGTGKTHTLRCIAHELSRYGYLVTYATLQEIMSAIRETYSPGNDGTEGMIVKKLMNADLIIIDELGVGKPSEWLIDTTYKLIDAMYRSRKPVLFGTNLTRRDLEKYFIDKRDGVDRITPRILERSPLMSSAGASNYRLVKGETPKAALAKNIG